MPAFCVIYSVIMNIAVLQPIWKVMVSPLSPMSTPAATKPKI
ncbi:hypothetical protein K413DRAFT_2860 [Clostridium sp. ASBs410]|nr:hypothetical protein K413DRAFT_2860 [Clostridium sp. ASBs410]